MTRSSWSLESRFRVKIWLSALLLGFTALLAWSATPTASGAKPCQTAAQNVTNLKNISCQRAKFVANKARRKLGMAMPDCKSQPAQRWNGWRVRGVSNFALVAHFKKGRMSFRLSGGGTCGPLPPRSECAFVTGYGWAESRSDSRKCRRAALKFKRKVAREIYPVMSWACEFARARQQWKCRAGSGDLYDDPDVVGDITHGWVYRWNGQLRATITYRS